ncbi:tyrosine-type recombinase/integrase [Lacisediminihabitans sp.]|uniref:tyrosine-type recombinase/integrase n=1 Tax=Lacisediminihabitans sp. TaxID=2787631 RepID=UPI00374D4D57
MGSITSYDTSSGKRYRVRYRKPDRSQTDKRGFRTKHDAELYLASVEVSKARGEYVDAAAARATVGELGATWLRSQTHLKPSSRDAIDIAWRLFVEPRWGDTPVGEIRHSEVQTWVSQLGTGDATTAHGAGPRSATVVIRAYGILAAILDVATRDRRISSNPARGVALPRKKKKPHVYLTHDRVSLLAEHAGDNSTLVLTLAYTGLRWGEAVGLRVKDLNTLRRRLEVCENAVRVGGVIVVGTPKTHATRSVPFPELLTFHLAEAAEGKSPEQLLFGDGSVHVATPSAHDGWFVAAVRAAQAVDPGFPRVTPHDLRHTAASLAISAGANVKAVQRMLGHASASMTLDTYADLFDDDLDGVAVALNDHAMNSNVGKMWARNPGSDA